MIDKQDIVLATTLAPRPLGHLEEPLRSWIDAGFRLVSVNSKEEINVLQDLIPDDLPIDLCEIPLSRGLYMGRPLVAVDDLLRWFSANVSAGQIAGYVNSDIFIYKPDLLMRMLNKPDWDLTLVQRLDIDSSFTNPVNPATFEQGYDIFFLKPHLLTMYPESNLRVGAPFWDYWMPLLALQKGMKVNRVVRPCCYHLRHEGTWMHESWYETLIQLMELMTSNHDIHQAPPTAMDITNRIAMDVKIRHLRAYFAAKMGIADPDIFMSPQIAAWAETESHMYRDALNAAIHARSKEL